MAKPLSLEHARNKAREAGLLGEDYYALSDSKRGQLNTLLSKTNWRQSSSQVAKGWSRAYSFYQSLKR